MKPLFKNVVVLILLFVVFVWPFIGNNDIEHKEQTSEEEKSKSKCKPISEGEVKRKIREWSKKSKNELGTYGGSYYDGMDVPLSEICMCSSKNTDLDETFLLMITRINDKEVNIVCDKKELAKKVEQCGLNGREPEGIRNKNQSINILLSVMKINILSENTIENVHSYINEEVEVDGIVFTTCELDQCRDIPKNTMKEIYDIAIKRRREREKRIQENKPKYPGDPSEYKISDSLN